MKLINLTPHSITLRSYPDLEPRDGEERLDPIDTVIPSTGLARVDMTPGEPETIEGIPVLTYGPNQVGNIYGLPEYVSGDSLPYDGPLYIVSIVVAQAIRSAWDADPTASHARPIEDIVYPGTGPKDGAIRDERGQIVAVTRLIQA